MEIILLNDYDGLGEAGDLVNVKEGFARNKLIPQGFAMRASTKNIASMEEKKRLIKKYDTNIFIAKKELEKKLLPFIIKRPLPNGECEYWKLSDLEIIDF